LTRGLVPGLLAASLAGAVVVAQPDEARSREIETLRAEIDRLQGELGGLQDRERGVLDELEQVDAELRLRGAQLREVTLRLDSLAADITAREERLGALATVQDERRRYLASRLREIYKEGPSGALDRLLGGSNVDDYVRGLGYAAYLSRKDVRTIAALHEDEQRLAAEVAALRADRRACDETRAEMERAQDTLGGARRRQSAALRGVREDLQVRRRALEDLEEAAQELSRQVTGLPAEASAPAVDVRTLKGSLDWPASGEVSAGYGRMVHPRFQTEVPHPGWDIAAEFGADVLSIFDGTVVYAAWMRGYGLTAIVDHGSGVLSVYAHTSVLLVSQGERVVRGQRLGKVGDTGSLRGPLLYFELRVDGRPVDPAQWLRR
jgi:septal ring factor EnvC (AmiA/AmiB activator)